MYIYTRYIEITILIIFKRAIQWQQLDSRCCATSPPSLPRALSSPRQRLCTHLPPAPLRTPPGPAQVLKKPQENGVLPALSQFHLSPLPPRGWIPDGLCLWDVRMADRAPADTSSGHQVQREREMNSLGCHSSRGICLDHPAWLT